MSVELDVYFNQPIKLPTVDFSEVNPKAGERKSYALAIFNLRDLGVKGILTATEVGELNYRAYNFPAGAVETELKAEDGILETVKGRSPLLLKLLFEDLTPEQASRIGTEIISNGAKYEGVPVTSLGLRVLDDFNTDTEVEQIEKKEGFVAFIAWKKPEENLLDDDLASLFPPKPQVFEEMTYIIRDNETKPDYRQANQKLKHFVRNMPSIADLTSGGLTKEQWSTDFNNEVSQLLKDAQITPFFKNKIILTLRTNVLVGIDEEERDYICKMFFFLDDDNPESGGIFDPASAVKIEREAIKDQIRLVIDLLGEMDKPIYSRDLTKYFSTSEEGDELTEWIQQFEKIHKEKF